MLGSDESSPWRRELAEAARFLTRLPIPEAAGAPAPLAGAVWAFPLVGIGIGLAGALVFSLATHLGLPPLAAGLLTVAATAALTGALHEDGLADAADGLIGGRDRETALAIMRDSRSGVFGVLALVFSVTLRAAALGSLAVPIAAAALIAAHAASRGGLGVVMARLEPARVDGLGAGAGRPSESGMRWSLGLGAVVALATLGVVGGFVALAVGAAAMLGTARLARTRIDGYTGDVLGACQQSAEVSMLVCVAALS
jgi:adenosylcobinamide-GDP ribazoletransferase